MERDQATKFMFDLLRLMVTKGGSDLFITAGFPPSKLTTKTCSARRGFVGDGAV